MRVHKLYTQLLKM